MVKIADLNPYITCFLCKGYMVNATAISECMHTFCKSCIVKEFIKNSACPECGISVNPTEPTKTLKSDNLLQDLVNKVVPGLATEERAARKQFYMSRGEPEEETIETLESTFLTPKKRALYRQAGLPVYVMLQHERNNAASSIRVKRYSGHMIRFPSELTIAHLKEFIRQRLSLGVNIPSFDDAKSQKAWERSRLLAIENAPDVDILCGDYLLDDDVTLGLLHRIRHGFVQKAMLQLTYRFRGSLKRPAQKDLTPADTTLSLNKPTTGKQRSHVACLSRGKEKTITRSVQRTLVKQPRMTAAVRLAQPLAPRTLLLHKSPVIKKAIVIQRSSKPPPPARVIIRATPSNGRIVLHKAVPVRKTAAMIQKPPIANLQKVNTVRPKGSVVRIQRQVRAIRQSPGQNKSHTP